MNRGQDTGAAAESVLQIDGAAVLLEKIAERLVRQLLKILHLVMAEKVKLPPGLLVELHAFARHRLALFQVPRDGATSPKLPSFGPASPSGSSTAWRALF